ncbi:unnamed protein product, partial [marine sediment metagenome]
MSPNSLFSPPPPPSLTVTSTTQSTSLSVPGIKEVPPARQFITRRWVIYSIVISCIAVAITLLVLAGLLFSQNQNYI